MCKRTCHRRRWLGSCRSEAIRGKPTVSRPVLMLLAIVMLVKLEIMKKLRRVEREWLEGSRDVCSMA